MKRTYTAWAIMAAETGDAGLIVKHADDGSGDKAPVLFRNQRVADRCRASLKRRGELTEVVRVEVSVTVLSQIAKKPRKRNKSHCLGCDMPRDACQCGP